MYHNENCVATKPLSFRQAPLPVLGLRPAAIGQEEMLVNSTSLWQVGGNGSKCAPGRDSPAPGNSEFPKVPL